MGCDSLGKSVISIPSRRVGNTSAVLTAQDNSKLSIPSRRVGNSKAARQLLRDLATFQSPQGGSETFVRTSRINLCRKFQSPQGGSETGLSESSSLARECFNPLKAGRKPLPALELRCFAKVSIPSRRVGNELSAAIAALTASFNPLKAGRKRTLNCFTRDFNVVFQSPQGGSETRLDGS